MRRLDGSVVLVAGGSGGIGLRCAARIRDEGASPVIIGDLAAPGSTSDAQDLDYRPLDITDAAGCERLVQGIVEEFGRLDALVVASGINYATYARNHGLPFDRAKRPFLLDTDDSYWAEIIDINLSGVMRICRAAGRVMAQAGGGAIVTTTSISATRASRGNSAYSVTKAGVWMLTKCMAVEFAEYGIRVNAIAPGLIATPMTADLADGDPATAQAVANIPLGRKGMPTDVASAAAFLVSPDSSFMTGSVLNVDGGEGAAYR